MSELDTDVKEFFESGGEKAPVEEAPKVDPEKTEVKAEEQKQEPKATKEEPKATKEEPKTDDDDPHAENHRKALKQTREELKKLKREKAEADAQREKELSEMREKFKAWTEAVNKQNQPETPKFEEDPANHLKQEAEMTKRELAELRAWRQQQEQTYAQQAALNQFQQRLRADEIQFAQENPDYDNAAQHVAQVWMSEFEIMGIPQEQRGQAYLFKVAQFANAAIRRGDSPAECVYELAKRVGYQVQKPEKPESEKKLESIQKGQEASKSLGNGKPDADFSLEALKDMSPEDIEKFVRDPKAWKKLANG